MNIYKVVKCSGGAFYKIFRAVHTCSGALCGWKYIGSCQYPHQAKTYVAQNGRMFNPKYDN